MLALEQQAREVAIGFALLACSSVSVVLMNDAASLAAIRRAARDGECLSELEELHIIRVGGEHAATYGEITPAGFTTLAQRLRLAADDEFTDLGSGLGRCVVQAAVASGVRRATGVEIAASRHALATKARRITSWSRRRRARSGRWRGRP